MRVIFAIRQNFQEPSYCEVIYSLVLPTRTNMLNHGVMIIIIIDQICSSEKPWADSNPPSAMSGWTTTIAQTRNMTSCTYVQLSDAMEIFID